MHVSPPPSIAVQWAQFLSALLHATVITGVGISVLYARLPTLPIAIANPHILNDRKTVIGIIYSGGYAIFCITFLTSFALQHIRSACVQKPTHAPLPPNVQVTVLKTS